MKKVVLDEEILQEHPVLDDFCQSELEAGLLVEVPGEEDPEAEGIGGGQYVPRLTCPASGNPYYTKTNYGGVNECILGSPQAWAGSALSNCVGYAWGRAYELLDSRPKLSRANAEDWWGYNDGYKRGQTPRLGAIACWRKGQAGYSADGAGHVAVVEEINGSTFKISQSGYGSSNPFWLTTYQTGSESHGAYTFQGFIYIGEWDEPHHDVLDVDGSWGPATTRYTQKFLGTTVDGVVSRQPRSNKKFLPNASTSTWEFKVIGYKGGSAMVRALQILIGADADGYFGKQSVIALQKFLQARGFYHGSIDGSMGPETVKAWQRFINSQF